MDTNPYVLSGTLGEVIAQLTGQAVGKPKPEITEEDWTLAMQRCTRDMAHDILKACDELPLLSSVTVSGTSTYIVCETQNAEFTITVAGRCKADRTDEPTFASKHFTQAAVDQAVKLAEEMIEAEKATPDES